ncbi:hypothetical protein STRDD11_02041 [Streptococcus sp. DD11]|nr:hypothetical protein STRDD11_02041 [Streptococcus sp. DD11]
MKRNEEQTGIKLPRRLINAVRVRIGPAVNRFVNFLGQPHVRIYRQQVQVHLVKFIFLAKGSPTLLVTAEGILLLLQISTVPGLQKHLNAADSHIRAALHPVLAVCPDDPVKVFFLGHIGRAVLKAKEIARRSHPVSDRRKAGLAPFHANGISALADQIADCMKGYLLIICTGLNDNITAGVLLFQLFLRKRRQIPEGFGPLVRQSHFFQERSRNPKSQGQAVRVEPDCLAGICRRQQSIGAVFFD